MAVMARYYHLSKKISEAESEQILRELRAMEDVKSVEMTEDYHFLKVDTQDGVFSGVMDRAVNICRRIAGGCEMRFSGFEAGWRG